MSVTVWIVTVPKDDEFEMTEEGRELTKPLVSIWSSCMVEDASVGEGCVAASVTKLVDQLIGFDRLTPEESELETTFELAFDGVHMIGRSMVVCCIC